MKERRHNADPADEMKEDHPLSPLVRFTQKYWRWLLTGGATITGGGLGTGLGLLGMLAFISKSAGTAAAVAGPIGAVAGLLIALFIILLAHCCKPRLLGERVNSKVKVASLSHTKRRYFGIFSKSSGKPLKLIFMMCLE